MQCEESPVSTQRRSKRIMEVIENKMSTIEKEKNPSKQKKKRSNDDPDFNPSVNSEEEETVIHSTKPSPVN